MRGFDKIIGYDVVKDELRRLVDMTKNPEKYRALGARLPQGVLLYGEPGVGKTVLAMALIEEMGVPYAVLRHEKARDSFCDQIQSTFEKMAKQDGQSVILLDDLDKFSMDQKNGEEFAVVQAAIDSVKDKAVFVIATANEIEDLPASLTRDGRFDNMIEIVCPRGEEAVKIITHYMDRVNVAKDINCEDVANMLTGRSCATLATVINKAAVGAAFAGKEHIEMEDFVTSTLSDVYKLTNHCRELSREEQEEIAWHEAGHVVIGEVLMQGSIGMISLCARVGDIGGFALHCKDIKSIAHRVLVLLGGKAACEMKYGRVGRGTGRDLSQAVELVETVVKRLGNMGFAHLESPAYRDSEQHVLAWETIVGAEMERYLYKAKEIIAENREFLDKLATELLAKNTLLYSDIKRIRESCRITPVAVGDQY